MKPYRSPSIPTGCFPADPVDPRARARALRDGRGPADREPARPHRSAVVRRRRAVPECQRACSSRRTTTCSACSTARACGSRTSAFRAGGDGGARGDAMRARSGARSPRTITCSAARRRESGSTMRSRRSSASEERLSAASRRPRFRPHQRCARDARVPSARAVRALQHRGDRDDRVAARSARSITGRSAQPAGRAASSPRTGPIPSSIPSSRDFAENVAQFGALTRRGHGDVARLSRRAPQSPRLLQVDGRDVDRPWPSDGANLRPRRRRRASGCSIARWRARHGRRGRGVSRPDADRDGADEPRRRPGHADSSRQLPQPQRRPVPRRSAATRAPTSRRPPTTSAR